MQIAEWKWAALLGMLFVGCLSTVRADDKKELPTDEEVSAYEQLYPSSVIRGMRFAEEPNPRETIREEIYLERELARRAEAEGTTRDSLLQADIRYYQSQEILNEMLRRKLPADAVTTAEVEQYYESHRQEFETTEMVKFRHIFFFVPPRDPEAEKQKRELAEKVLEKLRRGADFGELAAEYSDITKAKHNKGLVGPEKISKLNPVIRDALAKLSPGELSGLVRTPYGWEILKLDERIQPGVRPFEEVENIIRNRLKREKAAALQDQLGREAAERFPALVNNDLLETSGPLPRDAWVFAVSGKTTVTVERALADVYATWSYTHIQDERERLRAALPRLILTQQLLAVAQEDGLLDDPVVKRKLQLIARRLTGERYWRELKPKKNPTEKELRDYHAQNVDVFRTPPEAKGILFKWRYDSLRQTTGTAAKQADRAKASDAYIHETVRRKVEKIRQDAIAGKVKLEDLRKLADETRDLDWFPEGPSGYYFDKAFFGTAEKSFTELIPQRDGLAFGWVEGRREPKPRPFEECRELVERRWKNLTAEEMQKKLVDEILAEYARLR